jgi:hypothetical protein
MSPANAVTAHEGTVLAASTPKGLSATPTRDEMVAVIAALGPKFEERSFIVDRTATFPFENFADLRDAGFLALCVPT